eukprot:TRINITY_DN32931_c0_g1_i2.p1 TRINITY_DN32931_c0_g1~~TRINITY_DN32931_c0_g1_i2.p1  ORF type:complete len:1087 (+),score=288.38 TRINITY_DN32931_c0_g1_i2:1091-4351(+)
MLLRFAPLPGRGGDADSHGVLCEQHPQPPPRPASSAAAGGETDDGQVCVTLHCLRARHTVALACPLDPSRPAPGRVCFAAVRRNLLACYLAGHFVLLVDVYNRHRVPRLLIGCTTPSLCQAPLCTPEDLYGPDAQQGLTEQALRRLDASARLHTPCPFSVGVGSCGRASTPYTEASWMSPGAPPPQGGPRRTWGSVGAAGDMFTSPAAPSQPEPAASASPLSPLHIPRSAPPPPAVGGCAEAFIAALAAVGEDEGCDPSVQQQLHEAARAALAGQPLLLQPFAREGWRPGESGGQFGGQLSRDAVRRLQQAVGRLSQSDPTPTGRLTPLAAAAARSVGWLGTTVYHAAHGPLLLDLRTGTLHGCKLSAKGLYEWFRHRAPPAAYPALLHLLLVHCPDLTDFPPHKVIADLCRAAAGPRRVAPALFKEYLLAEAAAGVRAAVRDERDFTELVPSTALRQTQARVDNVRVRTHRLPDYHGPRHRPSLQLPVPFESQLAAGPLHGGESGIASGPSTARTSWASSADPRRQSEGSGILAALRERLASMGFSPKPAPPPEKTAQQRAETLQEAARRSLEEGVAGQLQRGGPGRLQRGEVLWEPMKRPRARQLAAEYAASAARAAEATAETVTNALGLGQHEAQGADEADRTQRARHACSVLMDLVTALEELSFPRPDTLNAQLARAAFAVLSRRGFLQLVRGGMLLITPALLSELRALPARRNAGGTRRLRRDPLSLPFASPAASPRSAWREGFTSQSARSSALRRRWRMSCDSVAAASGSDGNMSPSSAEGMRQLGVLADALGQASEQREEGAAEAQRRVEDAVGRLPAERAAAVLAAADAGGGDPAAAPSLALGWDPVARRFRTALTARAAARLRDAACPPGSPRPSRAGCATPAPQRPGDGRFLDAADQFFEELTIWMHAPAGQRLAALQDDPAVEGALLARHHGALARSWSLEASSPQQRPQAADSRRSLVAAGRHQTDFMPFEALRRIWEPPQPRRRSSSVWTERAAAGLSGSASAVGTPQSPGLSDQAREALSERAAAARWVAAALPELVQLQADTGDPAAEAESATATPLGSRNAAALASAVVL